MPDGRKEQDYTEHAITKKLLTLHRGDIVTARLLLESAHVNIEEQAELWQLIGAKEFFIRVLAEDYSWQLELIDRELEMEFQR